MHCPLQDQDLHHKKKRAIITQYLDLHAMPTSIYPSTSILKLKPYILFESQTKKSLTKLLEQAINKYNI
jgi:hypothetical protein